MKSLGVGFRDMAGITFACEIRTSRRADRVDHRSTRRPGAGPGGSRDNSGGPRRDEPGTLVRRDDGHERGIHRVRVTRRRPSRGM